MSKFSLLFFVLAVIFLVPPGKVLADDTASPSQVADPVISDSDDSDLWSDYILDDYIRDFNSGPDHQGGLSAPVNTYTALSSPSFALRNVSDTSSLRNVVLFEGSFDSRDVQLIVPYDRFSDLSIIDGKLVNVSNDTVQGRFLWNGSTLDPSDYDTYTYYLQPVYGSTNNVYNYGSFNYQRHYYLDQSGSYDRIRYDDMYGDFYVSDYEIYYSVSDRSYYLQLIIILLLGGVILCLRRIHQC